MSFAPHRNPPESYMYLNKHIFPTMPKKPAEHQFFLASDELSPLPTLD